MKNITIIGAGIIGLSSAYYLIKKGHSVRIIDRRDGTDNCSFGNAGLIVPSHFVPLAAPGMISKGIRWMFNPESPFFIKPRFDPKLIRWAWLFYRHANKQHVQRSLQCLKEYNLLSKSLYQQLFFSDDFDFDLHQKGLLILCKTMKGADDEILVGKMANENGIEARWYDRGDLCELEPQVNMDVKGGLYFPGDAHLTPNELMSKLKDYLEMKGVNFLWNQEVLDLEIQGDRVSYLICKEQKHEVEDLLCAGGAWSAKLMEKLRIRMPLQGGKGYSFEMKKPSGIQIPTVLSEAKVAVTPMNGFTRFAGTMEIDGLNNKTNKKRVLGIQKAVSSYYPDIKPEKESLSPVWNGLRPCSPDGLPYLGRTDKYKNLVIATGHAMMGLSMGPATGLMVSQLLEGKEPAIDISLLHPQRFD
jgi:D-amino-acid dehydrogenase